MTTSITMGIGPAVRATNGIGYQPLVRQILVRFGHGELSQIARERIAAVEKEVALMKKQAGTPKKKAA